MNRPRFRTDLVTSPVEENGNRFVDVTDPDSGRTFRFYEVEYAVATAMDGNRDVASLVGWAREELGLEPSAAEVETVISTLDDLGYLGETRSSRPVAAAGDDGIDVSDLSLGAPGRSPIRADERKRREAQNIDLGSAGRSQIAADAAVTQRPPTGDVELGAAGGADDAPPPLTGAPPAPPPLDIPEPPSAFGMGEVDPKRTLMGTGALSPDLSPPPAPSPNVPAGADLSVDLGQHINIGTDDVKEAVRASKVMSVPEMPDFSAEPTPGPGPMPMAGSTPIELPSRPPPPSHGSHAVPEPPPPVKAPSQGPSVITIILFVVLLAAVAGAAYYFLIYAADETSEQPNKPKTPVKTTKNPGATKAVPVGMVTKGETNEALIRSPRAGTIDWLIAADAVVEKDDVLVKFAGRDALEKKLVASDQSRQRYQTKLDKATAAGNKAQMQAQEANVKRKQEDLEKVKAELDAFFVRAPAAGTVTVKVENGASVEADAELVVVKSESWPTASFTIDEAASHKPGDKLEVVVKNNPSQTATCEVVSFEKTKLRIKCPPESNLAQNAALTLR